MVSIGFCFVPERIFQKTHTGNLSFLVIFSCACLCVYYIYLFNIFKGACSPLLVRVLETKKDFSSVKKDFSSVKKDFSSVKKDFSSVKKDFSSVKKDFSS